MSINPGTARDSLWKQRRGVREVAPHVIGGERSLRTSPSRHGRLPGAPCVLVTQKKGVMVWVGVLGYNAERYDTV